MSYHSLKGAVTNVGAPQLSNADLIAQKRAEIAAKMAKFGARPTLGGPSPASQIPPPPSSLPSRPSAATVAAAPLLNISDMTRQIQEAKRRAAASLATKAVQENPYLVSLPPLLSGCLSMTDDSVIRVTVFTRPRKEEECSRSSIPRCRIENDCTSTST